MAKDLTLFLVLHVTTVTFVLYSCGEAIEEAIEESCPCPDR
jgi:hypothetical protein